VIKPLGLSQLTAHITTGCEKRDLVRRSARSVDARLFSHWFGEMMGGKHVVVVVVSEVRARRHWVITAYLVGKLVPGDVEWKRN
jgi:phage tail tube protein FII